MIFSMGIISAAAGLYQKFRNPKTPFLAEDILKLAGQICRDEIEKDLIKSGNGVPGLMEKCFLSVTI